MRNQQRKMRASRQPHFTDSNNQLRVWPYSPPHNQTTGVVAIDKKYVDTGKPPKRNNAEQWLRSDEQRGFSQMRELLTKHKNIVKQRATNKYSQPIQLQTMKTTKKPAKKSENKTSNKLLTWIKFYWRITIPEIKRARFKIIFKRRCWINFEKPLSVFVANGNKRQAIVPRKQYYDLFRDIFIYSGMKSKNIKEIGYGLIQHCENITITRGHNLKLADESNATNEERRNVAQREGFLSFKQLAEHLNKIHGLPFEAKMIRW